MTTDHISPAGSIDPRSAAGKWLIKRARDPADLNVYASYRGNWEVMLRGLFTNRMAHNYLAPDKVPPLTRLEDGEVLPIVEASERLSSAGIPMVILAGERYGMGSSRDWAAKGVALLGCRAVIVRSIERIHRTNLIGMGVLPLEICDNFVPADAEIKPADRFEVSAPTGSFAPRQEVPVCWRRGNGERRDIACRAGVETWAEVALLQKGGVLSSILKSVTNR